MFDVIRNLIPYHTTLCSEMRLENIVEKENALLPFPKRQIIDTSVLKKFADNNFIFNENGRNISKWVENTKGKGEIAAYKQFLLFSPQCFHKILTGDR